MNICECLSDSARLFPDNVAVVFQGNEYSYRQLDELSRAACVVLKDLGLAAQDRVAIQLGNNPAFPVWYYAVLRAGAIAVSISTRLSPTERDFIIEDSGSRILILDQSTDVSPDGIDACLLVSADGQTWNQQKLLAATSDDNAFDVDVHDADPDQPALILYTSGTTGFPKGATLSHLNVRSNVAAFNHLCQMQTGDRVLLAVPLFHCFGQNALLNSVLNVGGTLILQERFDLNESKNLIARHRVNQLYGVPMMFQLLLESCEPDDLASVDYCFSAAAPLAISTSQKWHEKFGLPIHEGYGLTETSPFASYNHRNRYVQGSIGTPIDSVEMKVVDAETGQTCAPQQLGELAIRGPNVMLGYWNRPEETEQAVREGWFFSGDIGKQDEHGFFYIVDRVKDMIAVGGMKVFPAEVERVLTQLEGVAEAAVVGIEEPVLGEQVVGFITLDSAGDSSLAADELLKLARIDLATYKVPRRLFVIDQLPRNPSGKILKTQLRDLARDKMHQLTSDSATQPSATPSAEPSPGDLALSPGNLAPGALPVDSDAESGSVNAMISETGASPQRLLNPPLLERLKKLHPAEKKEAVIDSLVELVQQLTGEDETPNLDQTFLEIGMDSLMLVELGTQLQLELNQSEPLPATLLFDHPRISDLAEFVMGQLDVPSRERRLASASPARTEDIPGQTSQSSQDRLQQQVEDLSEEEALQELLKELEQ